MQVYCALLCFLVISWVGHSSCLLCTWWPGGCRHLACGPTVHCKPYRAWHRLKVLKQLAAKRLEPNGWTYFWLRGSNSEMGLHEFSAPSWHAHAKSVATRGRSTLFQMGGKHGIAFPMTKDTMTHVPLGISLTKGSCEGCEVLPS